MNCTSQCVGFKDRNGKVEKLENRKMPKADMALEGQEGSS